MHLYLYNSDALLGRPAYQVVFEMNNGLDKSLFGLEMYFV